MTVTQVPTDPPPNWAREYKRLLEWNPSRSLLASIRAYQHWRAKRHPVASLLRRVAVVRHTFWSAVCGADIPLNCRIGGGLLIPHPNGIVIHPDATIGTNCLIFQQVTLAWGPGGAPQIGAHVDIGAGAKLLGRVTVHSGARIGANAVVLSDVPAGATAVGVPARVVGGK
jgi:serine O-acetyltransferase